MRRKMGRKRKHLDTSVRVYDGVAQFMAGLKEQDVNLSKFVRRAINHYIPVYIEQMEIMTRWKKAIMAQLKYSGDN